MIEVLIAEDDALTRIGLQSMMAWEQYGYTIVGVAENGQDALTLAIELKPDIIITDIRMPVLDGLQLIRALKHEQLQAQFIILSAYNDFAYVREALQLGAIDYLLKLDIEPDLLLASLQKAVNLLPTKKNSVKTIDGTERELCIKKLLFGKYGSEQEVMHELKSLQIELPRKNLMLISCVEEALSEREIELVHYPEVKTIEWTLNELLREYGISCGCVIRNQEYMVVVSLFESYVSSNYATTRYEIITNIQEYFSRSYNLRFIVQVSRLLQNYLDISAAYKEICTNQKRTDNFETPANEQHICRMALKRIREALEERSEKALMKYFNEFFSCLSDAKIMDTCILQSLFISLVHNIDLAVQESALHFPDWDVDKEILQVSSRCTELPDFLAYAKRVQLLCLNALTCATTASGRGVVISAKQFIERNYSDNTLTLSDIADSANVSENYLCRLFKRELEISPMQYLTQVRLSQAKRLLKISQYQVKEICDRVGINNPFYFDRLFKRYTGITPTEFREI